MSFSGWVVASLARALDGSTLLLTLGCLLLVFAPVIFEGQRWFRRLPRRDSVRPPLASDTEVEDAVVSRLYGSPPMYVRVLPRASRAKRGATAHSQHARPRTRPLRPGTAPHTASGRAQDAQRHARPAATPRPSRPRAADDESHRQVRR